MFAAGFAFGANLYHEGSVSVVLPYDVESSSVYVPHMLTALQTAGSVLAPAGFVTSQTSTVNPNTPGLFREYTRNNSVGGPADCNVFLTNGIMAFSFVETGIPHSSSATVRLCNHLAGALRTRFGAEAVEVQFK